MSDGSVLTESFTYTAPSATSASGQVATMRLQGAGLDVTYSYTYDDNGNILTVSDGTHTTSYTYDKANQLLREDNQAGGFTHVWSYDTAGNILSRTEYGYTTGSVADLTPADTVNYTYGDEDWGDLLTAYDGVNISYDEIGNPLSDGTWSYTWEHGRELASMTDGTATWSFAYDVNGLRTSRTNGSTTYSYVYNGGSLSKLTVGNNTLYFTYGAEGNPLTLTHNGTTYFYATNLQGDVVAILNASGNPVVRYTYDAWGSPLTVTDTSNISLATLNPLRYRGYVFDPETGLYYLQSRYYDPSLGRFLNADAYTSTGQGQLGNNMFAYCNNRPVISADVDGYDAVILIDDDGPSHIGIMAQDENGLWWHFYWGSDPSMLLFCVFVVKPRTWCEPYTGVIRLDQINEAKQYSNNYEDILYLNGDYAECVVRMKNAEEYYGKYSLLFNNCSQVSLKILATAQTKFSEIYAEAAGLPIPHDAFSYVKAQVIYQQGNFEKYIATCLEAIAKPFRGK